MTPRFLMVGVLWVTAAAAQAPAVRMTYLGNMGVLLEAEGRRIVIDGFHRGGLAEYAAVPESLLVSLEGALAPYTSLTAALTTHRHLDHFDPLSVASRLRADTAMVYGAPAEVMDSVVSRTGRPPAGARIRSVRPAGGRWVPVAEGISALSLPHNPTRSRRAVNVGYLIEIGGLTVLHVGDADPSVGTYAPHQLSAAGIDVAIVPFWYLLGTDKTVRDLIRPRIWVASHIPPEETAQVKKDVLSRVPNAIVLTVPGTQYQLR